jgi:hypothetical protein
MGGREQGAQGGPLQIAADGRALRPGGVQDGQDILHGVLQDDRSGRVIREPGIALVEHDQPRERRQTRIPADQTRPLVVLLQMRGERRNQHQVHRSVTEHAIGDVDTRHCSHTEPRNQSSGHHEPRHPPDLRLHRVASTGRLSIQRRGRPYQQVGIELRDALRSLHTARRAQRRGQDSSTSYPTGMAAAPGCCHPVRYPGPVTRQGKAPNPGDGRQTRTQPDHPRRNFAAPPRPRRARSDSSAALPGPHLVHMRSAPSVS